MVSSGKEAPAKARDVGLGPGPRKIPHAAGYQPMRLTAEPVLWAKNAAAEPSAPGMLCNKEAPQWEAQKLHGVVPNGCWKALATTKNPVQPHK